MFILRADNVRDRWSGQVGLPGGRQEKDETDEMTVAREVFEEVGLILPELAVAAAAAREPQFRRVGRVHDRVVLQGTARLVVACLVYIQEADSVVLNLAPKEVAACAWVCVFPRASAAACCCCCTNATRQPRERAARRRVREPAPTVDWQINVWHQLPSSRRLGAAHGREQVPLHQGRSPARAARLVRPGRSRRRSALAGRRARESQTAFLRVGPHAKHGAFAVGVCARVRVCACARVRVCACARVRARALTRCARR